MSNWISVKDSLPEKNSRMLVLAISISESKVEYQVGRYGYFEWVDEYGAFPDADDDGLVSRYGFHYERESEGEYDSLIFDVNDRVTHWMPFPKPPK